MRGRLVEPNQKQEIKENNGEYLIKKSFIRKKSSSISNFKDQCYINPFHFTGIHPNKETISPSQLSRINSLHSSEIPFQRTRLNKNRNSMIPTEYLKKIEENPIINIKSPLKSLQNSEGTKSKGKQPSKFSIKDRRLKRIKLLGKAYLKDYTEFNFKIDSILNNGYTDISAMKVESPKMSSYRIIKVEAKDFINNLL